MITEIKGDLLSCDVDIVCHQTNFYGVMGGGVALSIKNHMLSEAAYGMYQQTCLKHGPALLGKVQYLPAANKNGKLCVVANLFCQDDATLENCGVLTRYDHMLACMMELNRLATADKLSIAMPGHIGCGIAGGDWAHVRQIIEDVFGQSPVPLTIVHWDQRSVKG